MEPNDVNYRQMSLQEAAGIDARNIAFYTLVDGTIIRIKKDGEGGAEGIQQSGEKIAMQYSQSSAEEEKIQMQNQNKNILQAGENYGYYMSNEGENIVESQPQQYQQQEQKCTCEQQVPSVYMGYNARLINAQIAQNQILNQLNIRNLYLSGPQYIIQDGPMRKRKFYKLIHAIPLRKIDIAGKQFINQNTNSQINFQQNNMQQKIDINERAMAQYNQQQEYQENVYQGEEMQGAMNDNQQNIEYCTCNLGNGNVNELQCTCPKNN
jgi:hypothetical protein